MGRLAWSQLRNRPVRLTALLVGMLVATTSFTLLTAAAHTAQLRTTGTVSAHFVPAYEILVRPEGSRTELETRTGTVQPNFLAGIFGGITIADYQRIAGVSGVDVAAPIAMVGYTLVKIALPVLLPAADNAGSGRELFRYTTSWVSDGGSSRIDQPSSYLYLTSDRLKLSAAGGTDELLPGGRRAVVCPSSPAAAGNPFGAAEQSSAWCWSRVNGTAGAFVSNEPTHRAFATVNWSIPMLIAAVDPTAEARLDGLNRAVTSGHYLGQSIRSSPGAAQSTIPVLAAATSGVGEHAETTVERLPSPSSPVELSVARMIREESVPGKRFLTVRTTAQQAYATLVRAMRGPGNAEPIRQIYTAGPTRYTREASGELTPRRVSNPISIWRSRQRTTSQLAAPMDNANYQYRKLRQDPQNARDSAPQTQVVGLFDPAKIRAFDPLSEVPLGPYQPTKAVAANAASRAALGGSGLLPSLNLGGYVSQPVDLVTSMSALSTLENAGYRDINRNAPISAIRVRVAGVTGSNSASLERIREVAQQIAVGTHLDVDIVAGSSPQPTAISLPAGRYGQPPLALTEAWVKKGVAVAILNAVDKTSVTLFVLILIACVLFVANAASAATRARRRELGVLACLGWKRRQLFASLLGEIAAIGLAAGVLGLVLALCLSSALGLHASAQRAALAVPIAAAVAVVAGLFPAWRAARADPIESVRPPILGVRRRHQPRGITGLAMVNLLRNPGRALVGAASLAIGIAAVTVLTALTFAFHGVVVGSVLGDFVGYQVRGVDYIAVGATIGLGIFSVADVIFLNIIDRVAELATIHTFGWPASAIRRLIITEGALLGLTGSVVGAALGLTVAAELVGQLPIRVILLAAAACGTGVIVTTAAALLPARALQRLPAALLIAQE
jgi:putative ABC transport system permease protein